MAFDLADFQANPGKYEMFRTARIDTNTLPHFVRGEHVAVEFVTVADDEDGVIVPVYAVTAANGTEFHLYAHGLSDFVL